jgi:hypothetical protein
MLRRTFLACAAILAATPALGATVDLPASRDNTLYEVAPDSTATSNALGGLMFAGQSGVGDLRRAVIAFDLASIPPGSIIQGATLTLYHVLSRTIDVTVGVHRVGADWGEGSSDATGREGRGVPATPGDATWLHRFFPGISWDQPGGDYAGVAGAGQTIRGVGYYSWSGPGIVADVQAWVDDPAQNFGWALIGNEAILGSMKWFATRENSVPSQRPVLTVEYTSTVPTAPKTWGGVKALYR